MVGVVGGAAVGSGVVDRGGEWRTTQSFPARLRMGHGAYADNRILFPCVQTEERERAMYRVREYRDAYTRRIQNASFSCEQGRRKY